MICDVIERHRKTPCVDISEDEAKQIIANARIRLVLQPASGDKYSRPWVGAEIFHIGRWKWLGLTTEMDDVRGAPQMYRVEGARKYYSRMAWVGARVDEESFECIYAMSDG